MEESGIENAANGDTCKFSFKKFRKGAQKSTRKRVCEKSSSSEDEETVVVKKERKSIVNPMIQSTKKSLKNQVSEYSESDSEPSENDDISISYKSKRTGEREGPSDMGATLHLQIDTEKFKLNPSKSDVKEEKKPPAPKTAMLKKGPIRAPENVRATVRWDYQPDICKDYKETGFCGFGDSCKFLHDRSDYKFGWQLEMEENNPEKEENYEIPEMKDNLPFKCFICRDSFKDPVVTKCQHYFCEKCALDHYKKTSRCYVCSTQTHGVFNPAREITARLAGESSKQGRDSDLDDDEDADNVGDVRRTKEEYEFNDEDAYTDFD